MGCREGKDPADFGGGVPVGGGLDPSQLQILDKKVVNNNTDPNDQVPDAQGLIWANVVVGVTNINFASDITFNWGTTDGTATSSGSSPHLQAVVGASATVPAGFSQTILTVPLNRKNSSGVNFTGQKTFTIALSGAVNATILDGTATITIDYDHIDPNAVNQVPIAGLSIAVFTPISVPEGDQLTFGVFLRPTSGGTVTVHYATADDSAVAPGDYTSKSGTLTFAPGDTQKTITIQTIANAGVEAQERFFVNLSSASGAAIQTAQAYGLIDADTGPVGLPASFTGWADADRVTYDEFNAGGGGGCKYKTACTGFAGAAVFSAMASFQGKGSWRFNPRKLFSDAGCTVCQDGSGNCNYSSGCGGASGGCSPSKVPNFVAGGGQVQRIDKNAVNLGSASTKYSCNERDVTADHANFGGNALPISATSHNDLIQKIKQAIFDNGAVYFTSPFYSDNGVGSNGWNSCRSADGYILRPFTSGVDAGHAWVLFGWDDSVHVPSGADPVFGNLLGTNIGCFRIQSSHGCDWGVPGTGRGYMPYSVITMPGTSIWHYWKFTWG